MNPSTAGADMDDPTCAKELRYARRWGYTRYLKGNMIAWRATSPSDIPPTSCWPTASFTSASRAWSRRPLRRSPAPGGRSRAFE